MKFIMILELVSKCKFFMIIYVDLKVFTGSLTMTGIFLISAGECKAGQVEEPEHLCIDHPS